MIKKEPNSHKAPNDDDDDDDEAFAFNGRINEPGDITHITNRIGI